jgi:hypothetical protein
MLSLFHLSSPLMWYCIRRQLLLLLLFLFLFLLMLRSAVGIRTPWSMASVWWRRTRLKGSDLIPWPGRLETRQAHARLPILKPQNFTPSPPLPQTSIVATPIPRLYRDGGCLVTPHNGCFLSTALASAKELWLRHIGLLALLPLLRGLRWKLAGKLLTAQVQKSGDTYDFVPLMTSR